MYTQYYNFKTKPFQLTPDPEFLFLSKIHKKALMYMQYGITSDGGGFILLTGEVGTGKTTIIRSILKDFNKDTVFSRITNTRLTSEQLMAMINDDFGLETSGKDKIQLLKDLTQFLIDQFIKHKKSILIIDEAQNLTSELLEEIRLLSNLETDKAKLLQIILIGQPELRSILHRAELRALRQRITVSCDISPLLREETEQYIFHRLEVAGNREAVTFQERTIDLIHNYSRGVPRLINILCDFILLAAYSDQTRNILVEIVQDVINDLAHENCYWQDQIEEKKGVDNVILFSGKSKNVERREEKDTEYRINKDDNEKTEIFQKIAETEKKMDTAVSHLRNDLINRVRIISDMQFSDLVKEVEELKKTIAENKQGRWEQEAKEEKKGGFLRRYFHKGEKNEQ
jgi:putative secretion ATPase (PEP-CTERM system associated)